MKRAAIAVSMCVGLAPSAAFALDWSLNTTQSETVELNSNQFIRTTPAGSVGSYSTLSGNAEALTPTSKFDFDADSTYKKYWGPGVDGLASEYLTWGLKAHYEVFEKTKSDRPKFDQTESDQTKYDPTKSDQTTSNPINIDREFVEAIWKQQSTSLALLEDFNVIIPVHGFLDRLTATGGIDRSISALDSLSLLATSTRTSYEPSGGGIQFTDTLARGVWRHKLSSITALTASSEVELLDFDNAFNTRIQIYRNQVGTEAALSPLLSFRGNIGAAYLITDGGVSTATPALPVSSKDLDWIGDAVLKYKMLKDTTLTLTANQKIGPSLVGSLFKTDSISAALSHDVNSRSTLAFTASGSRQITTATTDFVTTFLTYTYHFTKEWTTKLTYQYQHRFASSGTVIVDPITDTPTASGIGPADSHGIMLTVTHKYTVLPHGD